MVLSIPCKITDLPESLSRTVLIIEFWSSTGKVAELTISLVPTVFKTVLTLVFFFTGGAMTGGIGLFLVDLLLVVVIQAAPNSPGPIARWFHNFLRIKYTI